ncbi:sensor kinase/phosphatase LuxQ [Seminavis robusta]|uniref:histidine kinase n=1 Tax=Seminavis robusta TaxID=568900 RepID=A0A9N8E7N9_9STRA|nr:sensor kinase/phosphatase LuxQ [Seminavis robusta]|eukprot:Sro636_g179300.1 sensor kinase/phosphatase LuxQ (776) ;mRNA; f:31798-34125
MAEVTSGIPVRKVSIKVPDSSDWTENSTCHTSLLSDSDSCSTFAIPISQESSTMTALHTRIAGLEAQLALQRTENDIKDSEIRSLRTQLAAFGLANDDPALVEDDCHSSNTTGSSSPNGPDKEEDEILSIVDQVQKWLFLEGGHLRDVPSLLTQYCLFLRHEMGIPLDRLFVAGMMMPPEVSAYVWKWEAGSPNTVDQHEVPHEAFEKPSYNPNEPFAVLMEGRAMEYRMSSTSTPPDEVPPGCAWFTQENYQDYYALPMYHRGEFKGALAWSSKQPAGFTEHHIESFQQSLAALSTVLRCHTNEIVMSTLMGRLQDQVDKRTQELAMANQQLAEANEQIKQNSQQQLRHFAMMSHELRTPLNCVVGLSNLLLDDPDHPPETREALEMITTSADLLLAVVDDVLDFSKLSTEDNGIVKTQIRPIQLKQHLRAVVAAVRTQAQKAGLQLRCRHHPNVPEVLETDGRRLHQILFNLLGNAVKFGVTGEYLDLTVSLVVQQEGNSKREFVQFSIMDYGKGIAKEEQQKIFEPFQQAATNEPAHGGTGLGLAVVSKLLRVLGGNITLESEYGKYTNFIVKLPVKPPSEGGEVTAATSANLGSSSSLHARAGKPRRKRSINRSMSVPVILKANSQASALAVEEAADLKVLIAEDNVINQKVLVRCLQRIGIKEIDVVDNGQKAVDTWQKKDYSLLFMDLQMPVMDGIEATRIISKKKEELGQEYPKVVFLTAHALKDYQEQAAGAGGDGFISKPFKVDGIKSILSTLAISRQEEREKPTQ